MSGQNDQQFYFRRYHDKMRCLMTKPTKWHVRPAKTQFSLSSLNRVLEASLCAQWVAQDQIFLHADSEDSDHTERMSRLI